MIFKQKEMTKELTKIDDLQGGFVELSKQHLALRAANNPEFVEKFIKTFSDLIFSQSDDMLEKLQKTRPNSLLNAVFRATELGASFARKEISFIPYEIFRKEKTNGAERKVATGEYDAMVIPDINFQKQLILKLENCKHFYTAQVHEGVSVISNLKTGNFDFEGKNDVTKPTIGYYAAFTTTEGEVYDCFMTCAEIVERAKFSPQYKADNYKVTGNSIHFEKVVVRNLMKLIPKISREIQSTLSLESFNVVDIEHEDVTEKQNALEAAKKELAQAAMPEKKAAKALKQTEAQADMSENAVQNFEAGTSNAVKFF